MAGEGLKCAFKRNKMLPHSSAYRRTTSAGRWPFMKGPGWVMAHKTPMQSGKKVANTLLVPNRPVVTEH